MKLPFAGTELAARPVRLHWMPHKRPPLLYSAVQGSVAARVETAIKAACYAAVVCVYERGPLTMAYALSATYVSLVWATSRPGLHPSWSEL